MIEDDLDHELDRLSDEQHVSKAALIRQFVRERLQPGSLAEQDPLLAMVGVDDYPPVQHDDVLYPE